MPDARVIVVAPAAHDPPRTIGTKAATLADLRARGHVVPPFFVVSTEAFERARADPRVAEAVDRWRAAGEGAAGADEVRSAIAEAEVGGAIWDKVRSAYRERLGAGSVAVRSSAANEDGATRSFAGQFDSVLSVEGEAALGRAIRTVWASAYSDRAIAYRRVHGLGSVTAMAVIVQRMVAADTAGVLFTRDPADDDRMVVSATRGLAARLVTGSADGTTYFVHRATLESTRADPVDGLLSDDALRELGRLGQRLERELGGPQDVEWARAGTTLFVLQARPITGQSARRRTIWDNSNIVESYPGITLPLTFSLARESYAAVYRQAAELAGVRAEVIAAHDADLQRMIGLVRGRVYYDLGSWYSLLSLLPGFGHTKGDMEQMMGVREAASWEQRPDPTTWIRSLPLAIRMAFLGLTIGRRVRTFGEMVDAVCAYYDRIDVRGLSAAELVARYEELKRRIRVEWKAPILNDFLTMLFFGLLRRLIGRHGLDADAPGLHNDLLRGIGGMASVDPVRHTADLAKLVRADAGLSRLFATHADEDLADLLRDGTLDPALTRGVRGYLGRYGHRCAQELKLERPSLRDDPSPLFAAIRAYAERPDLDVGPAEHDDRAVGATAEARARHALAPGRLPLTPRWLVFSWVLGRTRRHMRDRETMRFARGRVFGLAREIFTGLGLRLHGSGELDDPRDVFYLTVDEVCAAARRASPDHPPLRQLVAERQIEFAGYLAEPPLPERLETDGSTSDPRPVTATDTAASGDTLRGLGCCAGFVEARAAVVLLPERATFVRGDILVARETDPSWVTVFPLAAGILIERGSLLSHSAIVARELGIPAIVGVRGLTASIGTGDRVAMDGRSGIVRRRS